MKTIVIQSFGEPNGLQLVERQIPVPEANQVLIRVHAAGINRPDIFQRMGQYPAPAGAIADVPGLEISGIIEACGLNVTRWHPGDRVCALLPGGGYAEYATVHAAHCLPVPDHIALVEAACIPETVFTVWHNVFQRGQLSRGETFLVHGGSGGIGTTAIQLAALAGARTYATAGTDEKCRYCEELGAISCINYRTHDFGAELAAGAFDVVLDSVGAPYFDRNITLLAPDGRLVYINAVGGRQASFNISKLMQKRLTITGSTLRNRDAEFKAQLCSAIEQHVWPWFISGRFRPVIHQRFPLAHAAEAHRLMEAGDFIGKLVLEVNPIAD